MASHISNLAAKALFGASAITESHRVAGKTLVSIGELFFSGERFLTRSLKLRLSPLIVGPTGVGKTSLVQSVARLHNARYLKVTRSDWIVQGSTRGRPTMYQILDYITTHTRVLLHIDELDKFQISFGAHEWSASIAGDLWSILDGAFPIPEYLRDTPFPEQEKPTELQINKWIQSRCFIVSSGTWQGVFERNRSKTPLGFQRRQPDGEVDMDAIARADLISPELLHRFNSDLLFLRYPNREETARLLESTGISALAREMGEEITPEDVNYEHGGMRELESIATRLVIARYERHGKRPPAPAPMETDWQDR